MEEQETKKLSEQANLLTAEQEELLDKYLQNLDSLFENMKTSEKIQVEIETLHLKRILHT